MNIRKGIKLLEEREGDGDLVRRQWEYVLSMRFTLSRGDVIDMSPVSVRPCREDQPDEPGFYEFHERIDRVQLINGIFYAVQGMRIGGYRKVVISPHLAYGEEGYLDIVPPNAKLTVEIKVQGRVHEPRKRRQQAKLPEAEALTQEQMCRRYQIDPPTLWQRRKAGLIPAPVVSPSSVQWSRQSVEEWDKASQPRVSPNLDEADSESDQAFERLMEFMENSQGRLDADSPEAIAAFGEEYRRLEAESNRCNRHSFDLALELAVLIDDAGQWPGPPLEPFVNGDDVSYRRGAHFSHTLETILGV